MISRKMNKETVPVAPREGAYCLTMLVIQCARLLIDGGLQKF